jgi:GT2 family glycosyltransferase
VNSTPDISVIIVNYNVKDYLLQCLRSLNASVGSVTTEVIVVDNDSHDGSVDELQPLFPSVRWIALDENIGFGRANNVGLEHASGRYVLYLNPDTIIGADTLSVMCRFLDEHPTTGIAGCKVLNPDGSFQVACRRGLPTPWVSFCKLFGLQRLFPSSKLFAGYNLTYLPVDDTYAVDALIGAFMVGRTDLMRSLGGFDPAFFMYGEDIDLCYRVQQAGFDVTYVHTTSIVHYKGESTKRSSINEVRVFYDAMEIFAKKHFGGSRIFLAFLRLGIGVRAVLARALRKRREIITWLLDMLALNAALLAATSVRFDGPFGFPEYAYPLVQIVVTLVATFSLVAVGEYVEYRPTVRRSIVGLLVTFFVLSSLTYFFKEYAFSRGVLLMTIGFTAVAMTLLRGVVALREGSRAVATRRVLLVGCTPHAERIAQELETAENRHTELVGIVATSSFTSETFAGLRIVGDATYLARILDATGAQEVILTDPTVSKERIMELMIACSGYRARFHLATDYDDVITARIINDVAGVEPTVSLPPLLRFRNRVAKRFLDVIVALLVLTLSLLGLILPGVRRAMPTWFDVLRGRRSVVGLYPDGKTRSTGRMGVTGLAHISSPKRLSSAAVSQLNDYYIESYTLALDIEIILKHLLRRLRGNNISS